MEIKNKNSNKTQRETNQREIGTQTQKTSPRQHRRRRRRQLLLPCLIYLQDRETIIILAKEVSKR